MGQPSKTGLSVTHSDFGLPLTDRNPMSGLFGEIEMDWKDLVKATFGVALIISGVGLGSAVVYGLFLLLDKLFSS